MYFFLLINNEQPEKESKKIIPFTIASKKNKILWNKFNSEDDVYIENYETLLKEIKGNANKWKNICVHGIGRFNIVKMLILHKAIHRVNVITVKIPAAFLAKKKKKKKKKKKSS